MEVLKDDTARQATILLSTTGAVTGSAHSINCLMVGVITLPNGHKQTKVTKIRKHLNIQRYNSCELPKWLVRTDKVQKSILLTKHMAWSFYILFIALGQITTKQQQKGDHRQSINITQKLSFFILQHFEQ